MSIIKSKEEIKLIKEGGQILHRILRQAAAMVKPGMSTGELNDFAEKEILKAGGRPSFKNYGEKDNLFPAGLCTSINEVVVHGIPSKKELLKEGDIVGLDIGMEYKGLYTDTAISVPVGKVDSEVQKLLEVTEKALQAGIKQAQPGNRIGDIGAAIQAYADKAGLGVVRDLVGHGVGHDVHEDPQVPNYGKAHTGRELKEGMVLAIEPMFTLGTYKLLFDEGDGWTISTADGKYSAHFEHTVAVTKGKPEILT
ncbi:MAG: type I methionyl aminopeptidase [Candidatus Doudnabacteria bacterium]